MQQLWRSFNNNNNNSDIVSQQILDRCERRMSSHSVANNKQLCWSVRKACESLVPTVCNSTTQTYNFACVVGQRSSSLARTGNRCGQASVWVLLVRMLNQSTFVKASVCDVKHLLHALDTRNPDQFSYGGAMKQSASPL